MSLEFTGHFAKQTHWPLVSLFCTERQLKNVKKYGPGQFGSVVTVTACGLKVPVFHSGQGHVPQLKAQSPAPVGSHEFFHWGFPLIATFPLQCPQRRNWFLDSRTMISLNVISIFHILPYRFLHQETVGSDSCQKNVLDLWCPGKGIGQRGRTLVCLTHCFWAVGPWASYFISEFVYVSAKQG